ncbi:MAG: hypothetical protein AB8B58_17640 [Roseobacter sp.]
MKCLLRNKENLAAKGVAVPGPGRYRKLLRDTFNAMKTGSADGGAPDVLLDAILDVAKADRVLLSNANFFGAPRAAMRHGILYPMAPRRMKNLCDLFPDAEIELFMALRNPASFLPHAFQQSPRADTAHFMDGVDPRMVRWSDSLLRIRQAVPQVPITVWCNEDAPLIWSRIVRDMADLSSGDVIIGAYDLLSDIITPDSFDRFSAYMAGRPDLTEPQIQRIVAAFMEKFAQDGVVEEELDMPGWTDDLVADMSRTYDEDIDRIAQMPGVRLITP